MDVQCVRGQSCSAQEQAKAAGRVAPDKVWLSPSRPAAKDGTLPACKSQGCARMCKGFQEITIPSVCCRLFGSFFFFFCLDGSQTVHFN